AADRVRELIDEGIGAGAFRNVSAAFVGEVVTATMRRITSGEIGQATGLDDAKAYAELARLVLAAVRR
ncbi:MAG: TetR/AcrR family transcriptional regulator, partial [Microlunatus sp.]|nr:TetR/AcrR family transcriptional regulator [Microlunatus sp.]